MGKIEERYSHLKSDIEELRIAYEKSQTVLERAAQFGQIFGQITPTNTKDITVIQNFLKESLSDDMNYFHDCIALIEKTSSKTAERLREQVKDYEKAARRFIDEYKNIPVTPGLQAPESLIISVIDFWGYSTRLHNMAENIVNCLLDTLDYLEE